MGFMDKAKQAAKQAQQMLDEQQAKFNQSQGQGAPSQPSSGASYDQHGRPAQPAGVSAPASTPDPQGAEPAVTPDPTSVPGPVATPDPEATSAGPVPAADPAPGADEVAPHGAEDDDASPPQPTAQDGLNATPDPFRPIGG